MEDYLHRANPVDVTSWNNPTTVDCNAKYNCTGSTRRKMFELLQTLRPPCSIVDPRTQMRRGIRIPFLKPATGISLQYCTHFPKPFPYKLPRGPANTPQNTHSLPFSPQKRRQPIRNIAIFPRMTLEQIKQCMESMTPRKEKRYRERRKSSTLPHPSRILPTVCADRVGLC